MLGVGANIGEKRPEGTPPTHGVRQVGEGESELEFGHKRARKARLAGLTLQSLEKLVTVAGVWEPHFGGYPGAELRPAWVNHVFCAENGTCLLGWPMPGSVLPVGPAHNKSLGLGFSGWNHPMKVTSAAGEAEQAGGRLTWRFFQTPPASLLLTTSLRVLTTSP